MQGRKKQRVNHPERENPPQGGHRACASEAALISELARSRDYLKGPEGYFSKNVALVTGIIDTFGIFLQVTQALCRPLHRNVSGVRDAGPPLRKAGQSQ